MLYLYTAEIFPTVNRSMGVGMSSVAPFIGSLEDTFGARAPLAVFGIVAFLSGLLALYLPETKDRKIPDTLEEGDRIKCSWKDGILDRNEKKRKEVKDRQSRKADYIECPQPLQKI